jgi:hypothetical protein
VVGAPQSSAGRRFLERVRRLGVSVRAEGGGFEFTQNPIPGFLQPEKLEDRDIYGGYLFRTFVNNQEDGCSVAFNAVRPGQAGVFGITAAHCFNPPHLPRIFGWTVNTFRSPTDPKLPFPDSQLRTLGTLVERNIVLDSAVFQYTPGLNVRLQPAIVNTTQFIRTGPQVNQSRFATRHSCRCL